MRFCLLLGTSFVATIVAAPVAAQSAREGYLNAEARQSLGDWRLYRNYDYDRPEKGRRNYYADRYYRDGRYYEKRILGPDDRIYRGSDNRYYCRRPDGTTGLIIAGVAGGVIGKGMAIGGSRLLGADATSSRPNRGPVVCR